MSKVYLHFGGRKTGSTAIQNYLSDHHDELFKSGIFYNLLILEECGFDYTNSIQSGNGLPLYRAYLEELDDSYIEELYSKLIEPTHISIISSEMFPELSLESMIRLKIDIEKITTDYEIIFYIRNPIQYILSAYDQDIKRSGEYRSFSDYIRSSESEWPYPEQAKNLYRVFGRRLQYYNYDSNKSKIIEHFFENLSSPISITPDNRISNRSLLANERNLLRNINQTIGPEKAIELSDYLILHSVENIKGSPEFITARDMTYLFKRFGRVTTHGRYHPNYPPAFFSCFAVNYSPNPLGNDIETTYLNKDRDVVNLKEITKELLSDIDDFDVDILFE